MPNFKTTLTAAEFARIGDLALHESWQMILATGMRVDLATINSWAKSGTPADITESLRTFLGARRDNISGALDLLLEEPFKPWERGDEVLKDYEGFTDDPTMIYSGFEDNRDMVVRVIADLLHYCMYKISTTGNFIDMDAVIQDAIALYNSDPEHCATPISKQAQQSEWMSKDFIPYVLTDDPAKLAQFGKKFGMTQDQAVDDLIETTDWGGQDLPHLVGNKGTPTERLAALRYALRACGITDDKN